jgi:hypothetical protein
VIIRMWCSFSIPSDLRDSFHDSSFSNTVSNWVVSGKVVLVQVPETSYMTEHLR